MKLSEELRSLADQPDLLEYAALLELLAEQAEDLEEQATMLDPTSGSLLPG